ncbi:13781_t:CDS:2 [Entrophospora sp. SA101]|nr:13781_t:CDS:2 [Entrophospora sp. SA101]
MHAKGFSPMIESTLTRILSSDPNVINLQIHSKKIPLGYWSEIKNYDNCLELFKLYKKCSLEYTSATSEDFDKMIEIYLEEIEDYKTYSKTHRFFGQKIASRKSNASFTKSRRAKSTTIDC